VFLSRVFYCSNLLFVHGYPTFPFDLLMLFMAVTQSVLFVATLLILLGIILYLILERKKLVRGFTEEAGSKGEAQLIDLEELNYLKEQLSSFHQAMAQCPSAIIIADLDGNIQYVNAQFTHTSGYEMEDVIGRNPRFLKSGNMDPAVYKDLWETILRGDVWRGDLENRGKDGRVFWEYVSISPIKDAAGDVLRYFAVKEDITESRLRENDARGARLEAEAMEAADQAKAVFLKMIGHEMKNPVNRVLGFTNLLSQSQLTNDQLKQLNQVGNAGLEILAMIDRILDFTSAETGTMELAKEPFKPAAVVDQLLKFYEQKAAERNVVIQRQISESIPDIVIGDEKRFKEVIDPLLANAVKFTFKGSITFRLSANYNPESQVWEFHGEVSDTGIGIPAEKLEQLFKPFFQLEPGLGEGTGLGLALSQRLCILQGGLLSAESEAGKGSVFSFDLKLLPMDKDDAAVQVAQVPDGPQFAITYPVDILVAEDNRINRRLLETLMLRLGYKASFALDGSQKTLL
jgi:PAS domain S-box-containing protein